MNSQFKKIILVMLACGFIFNASFANEGYSDTSYEQVQYDDNSDNSEGYDQDGLGDPDTDVNLDKKQSNTNKPSSNGQANQADQDNQDNQDDEDNQDMDME